MFPVYQQHILVSFVDKEIEKVKTVSFKSYRKSVTKGFRKSSIKMGLENSVLRETEDRQVHSLKKNSMWLSLTHKFLSGKEATRWKAIPGSRTLRAPTSRCFPATPPESTKIHSAERWELTWPTVSCLLGLGIGESSWWMAPNHYPLFVMSHAAVHDVWE